MVTKVAVYGSLRQGLGNNPLLGDSKYLGSTTIDGFDMYSLEAFPAIVPTKNVSNILVEIFEVTEDVFKRLDMLEGYPSFYDRMEVDTEYGKAWIYFHHTPPTGLVVESGDWYEYIKGY